MPTQITSLKIISKDNDSNPEFIVSGSEATLTVWSGDKNIKNSGYFKNRIVELLKKEGVDFNSIKTVIANNNDKVISTIHLRELKKAFPSCNIQQV